MDLKPAAGLRASTQLEIPTRTSQQGNAKGNDQDEDPFSLSGTTLALFGLVMACAVVGIPLVVVLTERPQGRESSVPTAMNSDGFKPSSPISRSRLGKSNC